MQKLTGRYSVDKDDSGYKNWHEFGHDAGWKIYVDGKEIPHVKTADTQKGIVVARETDEDGNFVVRNHEVREMTYNGVVTVLIRDISDKTG